jgi:hypothetical protein
LPEAIYGYYQEDWYYDPDGFMPQKIKSTRNSKKKKYELYE